MIKSTTSILITSLAALVITFAIATISVQPATAQTAKKLKCNGCVKSKQIKNNGIKGTDIKDGQVKGPDLNADLSIGTASNDGDLSVKSTAGSPTVSLDGATGDVTNSLPGNGLVKAWARIKDDGSILSCWRCNMDTGETRKLSIGSYEVDFTPLGTDISDRPRTAITDLHDGSGTISITVSLSLTGGDSSSVTVKSWRTTSDVLDDESFTLLIF